MKRPNDLDLTHVEAIYAISNTPLFLLYKLRMEPTVQQIATLDGKLLLDELTASLGREPKTLNDRARPYAYLVALSLMPELSYLREAAQTAAPYHEWFSYIARALIDIYPSRTFQSMYVGHLPSSALSTAQTHTSMTRTDLQGSR